MICSASVYSMRLSEGTEVAVKEEWAEGNSDRIKCVSTVSTNNLVGSVHDACRKIPCVDHSFSFLGGAAISY